MTRGRILSLCCMLFAALAHRVSAQDIPWRLGRWNPDSFGNQRVVLHVTDPGTRTAVRALIAWRRRDAQPELKRLIVTNSRGQRISNAVALRVRRDSGDVVFEPTSGAGDYFLYYSPYAGNVRSNYPRITYPAPDSTAAPPWISAARSGASLLPTAAVAAFEAVDSMSQRWPMEVTATPSEVDAVRRRIPAGDPVAVFVEDRTRPIKMTDQLPLVWSARDASITTLGPALRDEYYAFQLGLWAQQALDSVTATFSSFSVTGAIATIPRAAFDCVTTDGIDWLGKALHRRVSVTAGNVGALWCGVMIPKGAVAGSYRGTVAVRSAGGKVVTVPMQITVGGELAVNHGDDEPWRLSRLRWHNSTLAADGPPTPPYTPIRAIPGGFAILGRRIQLDSIGFPRQITSLFTTDLAIGPKPHPLLRLPFALEVEGTAGEVGKWRGSGVRTLRSSAARVEFTSQPFKAPFTSRFTARSTSMATSNIRSGLSRATIRRCVTCILPCQWWPELRGISWG